jgi:hypothetical protein
MNHATGIKLGLSAFALATALSPPAVAEPTALQQKMHSEGVHSEKSKPDQLNAPVRHSLAKLATKFDYLDRHFVLMAGQSGHHEIEKSLASIRSKPAAAADLSELYSHLTELSVRESPEKFSEARWRAVYVLGQVDGSSAKETLSKIAHSSLPQPRDVSEATFKSEYRIRARAIAGLERQKDVASLEKLYAQKSLLSGLAAASLYELGHAPAGIELLDAKKVMGDADPTDRKPGRGAARLLKMQRIPTIDLSKPQAEKVVPTSIIRTNLHLKPKFERVPAVINQPAGEIK